MKDVIDTVIHISAYFPLADLRATPYFLPPEPQRLTSEAICGPRFEFLEQRVTKMDDNALIATQSKRQTPQKIVFQVGQSRLNW